MKETVSPVTIGKLLCCLPLLLLLSGCNDPVNDRQPEPQAKQRVLRIALIPEIDIFAQKKRYEPLMHHLEDKMGVTIDLKILSRYGNIIDNFVSEGLDGAFLGSFTGALALQKLDLIPLARPEDNKGTSTYYGMVFVRKDSGIKSADDMKGKRFAFVDKATTAGWLLPLHFFQEIGVEDYQSWFGETYFTGTHNDAIYDVLNKNADIGAAKNTVFERLAAQDPRIIKDLEILTTSMPVPENTLAVRSDLDDHLITGLKETLLTMDQDPDGQAVLCQFGAVRFIATTPADYQVVLNFAELVGLDLANYTYVND